MVLFQSFTNLVKISHKSIYLASFVIILTAKYGIYPLCVILSDKMADFTLVVSVFCAIIKPCRPILYENNVWYNLCLYLFRQPMMLIMLIGRQETEIIIKQIKHYYYGKDYWY